MALLRALSTICLAFAASAGAADDWRYAIGLHDFAVPDVDSHTYGLDGRVSVDRTIFCAGA
jgi:hypothetical protein